MKKYKRIGTEMLNILIDNSNGVKKKDLCVRYFCIIIVLEIIEFFFF